MANPNLDLIKRIGYSDVYSVPGKKDSFFFEAGMMIDADGGYHAYHPNGSSGLDYLGNAGKPGNWWALATNTGTSKGVPVIQGPDDPAPGFYVSTTALEDASIANPRNPRRYVNSEAINYIVLPGGSSLGAKLGDMAVVIRPSKNDYDYAIYADVGPTGKIGEGSIALAQALGIPSSPKSGGIGHGLIYVVFPGSGNGKPRGAAEIDEVGAAAFARWGGMDRAREFFNDSEWA